MEKRTLLAVVISLAILFSYSAIMSKMQPIEKEGVIDKSSPAPSSIEQQAETPASTAPLISPKYRIRERA